MKRYQERKEYKPEVLDKLHKVQLQILEDFIRVCEKYELTYFAVYGTAIGAVRHGGFIPWDDDIDVGMLRKDYDRFFEVFEKELGDKYNLLTPEIDGRYACTVTHIQRKGTKFVSEMSRDLKCEQCIFMDIFPFDYVAKGKKEQLRQGRKANFWGKMLFLSGTAYPLIPYDGIKGKAAEIICKFVHYLLKWCGVTPKWLYKNYVKTARQYNDSDKRSEYVTSFEYVGCLKDKIKEAELFPMKKVPFEKLTLNIPANNHEFLTKVYGDYMQLPPIDKRVNHMPLVIDFGEENYSKKEDED